MTTANCPGNGELDFRLIFGEDGQQQPLGPAAFGAKTKTSWGVRMMQVAEEEEEAASLDAGGGVRQGGGQKRPLWRAEEWTRSGGGLALGPGGPCGVQMAEGAHLDVNETPGDIRGTDLG
ncbi:hypothetical protein EYF80_022993 [Liparis tanakae]|uniref:Uncharacterized protein n=1 Tax=Liparis tanakae TaxID=230148 RepID=A0A4Z2HMI3_9TELE|nr:hypothetical protein EYF80_022993 [Liparis tanakae]